MQATMRVAMPLRVHQIWDAISHSGPNQLMDFEKLMSVLKSMHKLPQDELNHELNYAIKDGLVTSEAVETQRREETEIYKIPDAASILKDKSSHDWYCFQCHLGGQVVKCEDCHRVYHLDCLPEDRKPEKDLFVCPACHIIATKPSAERVQVKQKVLNQLLQYICDRFKTWQIEMLEKAEGKVWAMAANRGAKDAWRFDLLVHTPMDLQTMIAKANQCKYNSLEEFQVDCETLVHAIGVYFGVDMLKGGQIGQAFLRDAMHDIQEIKLCHDCFRRSNEKNHDWWFCLPCSVPHEVVWAKQSGYPYWPAKVMKKDGNKYDVRYFGGNYERGIIDAKNIQPIETSTNQLKVRKTALWNEAFEELTKFQEIAKDPDLAAKLPARGGKGGSSATKGRGGGKRASQSPDEVPAKRGRKSEYVATPKSSKKPTSKSAPPQTNGTPASATGSPRKKTGASAKSAAAPARRESTSASRGSTTTTSNAGVGSKIIKITAPTSEKKQVYSDLANSNLDPDVIAFLNELEDVESLDGDAYFSDEDSSDTHEKVSEDAVSSSCNESKSTRSVYIQVTHQGIMKKKLINRLVELQTKHTQEVSQNKKKQWCYNCEREAIYHCCWNTAYCSIECQQVHWTREHKRLCRRVRRERTTGTTATNAGGDEY